MPQPRIHPDQAARQRAYRLRKRQGSELDTRTSTVTKASPRTWSTRLANIRDEMQQYWEERSERWQEGDRGELLRERIDELTTIIEELQH